ncbi:hypothetical protein FB561_5472 [Kribbella amoyensis]|uniref:Uncharacterized protein n=1 Tax=Kribbella amoyensis TaxID=996641 RepID=A0A561BZR0_9ACTN|nr:hypothetical protein [Kribbella amoyensis]TWD84297.1 hypothetical protein FB561_5472 [Kribbella amoyensis]
MADELLRPTIAADVDLTVRPWRQLSQAYVAFFGGVIASTVIAFVNARRLGVDRAKQRLILLVGTGSLIVAIAVATLLTDHSTGTSTGSGLRLATRIVAVLCCLVLLRIQRPMDRAFQLRGADYGSLWGPGLAAVIGGAVVEALLIAFVVEVAL